MNNNRFCPFCGKEVAQGESHCMECGNKLPEKFWGYSPEPKQVYIPTGGSIEQNLPQGQPYIGPVSQSEPVLVAQPTNYQVIPSQSYFTYLKGVLLLQKPAISYEFMSLTRFNSLMLLLTVFTIQFFMLFVLFSSIPYELTDPLASEILQVNNDSSFTIEYLNTISPFIFTFYSLLFLFVSIIIGIGILSLLFTFNSIKNARKYAFIIATSTLVPIIGIGIIRFFIVLITRSNEVTVISSNEELSIFLGYILDWNLTQNIEIRLALLSIRMIWSFLLFNTMLSEAKIIKKENTLIYSATFAFIGGGGSDIFNQFLFLFQ